MIKREESQPNGMFFPPNLLSNLISNKIVKKFDKEEQKKSTKLYAYFPIQFQLRGTILLNLMQQHEKEKDISAKEVKGRSTDNMKEIYYKGSIIKGRLKKRMLHGDAEIVYENGVQFKGAFKNGKMRTGKFDFQNGYEYWGELQGKNFIGKGTLKCPNGTLITGVWNGDELLGRAEIEYHSGDVYYGEVKKFQKHGEGYLFFKSGNKYIGHFQNGEITGMGKYFKTDGTSLQGEWKNGQLLQPNQDQKINKKSQKEETDDEVQSDHTSEVQNNFQAGQNLMPNASSNSNQSSQNAETSEKSSEF